MQFVQSIHFSCQIVSRLSTKQGSETFVLCTTFQHDLIIQQYIMCKQDFVRFEVSDGRPRWQQHSGALFTKCTDDLPKDLVKTRSHEIGCHDYRAALKFDRNLGSAAAEDAAKFQSDWKSLSMNPRLQDFTRSCGKTSVRLVNRGPWCWA